MYLLYTRVYLLCLGVLMKKNTIQKTKPVQVQKLIDQPVERPQKKRETALGWFVYTSIQLVLFSFLLLFYPLGYGIIVAAVCFLAIASWYLPITVLSYVGKNAKIPQSIKKIVLIYTYIYPICIFFFAPLLCLLSLLFSVFLILWYRAHWGLLWKMTFLIFIIPSIIGILDRATAIYQTVNDNKSYYEPSQTSMGTIL